MPATYDYYTKHSRKVSSSQMSLPEQLQNASNEPPTRSLPLLPATTYLSSNTYATGPNEPSSPDAYYHQYQNSYDLPTAAPLRQGALKTIDVQSTALVDDDGPFSSAGDRQFLIRNGSAIHDLEPIRAHMSSPGLRGRKSSVKNLVEKYNASSTEDLPPVPANSSSRNGSRNVSPVLLLHSKFQQSNAPRQRFNSRAAASQLTPDGDPNNQGSVSANIDHASGNGAQEMSAHNRRPLFGEVVIDSQQNSTPGYGIQVLRHRSGSEGSPMQTPNLSAPQNQDSASRSNYDAITAIDNNYMLRPAVYNVSNSPMHHRRTNSEVPLTPTRIDTDLMPPNPPFASGQTRNHGGLSRIPVSVRHGSASSDVDTHSSKPPPNQNAASSLPTHQPQQPSPRRRPRSPPEIQSPGQRGKKSNGSTAPRSPSLRANIIVPLPKISPPLRSSRPRVPISSASTAASRAKMAEKFSALQKMNEERRQSTRKVARPPELSDVDFKARRLRITQALSRSLEGQELKGNNGPSARRDFGNSQTASPALSAHSEAGENQNGSSATVTETNSSVVDTTDDISPVESVRTPEQTYSQNALDAMQGTPKAVFRGGEPPAVASSSLHYLNRPALLQTNLAPQDRSDEPSSAMTQGTTIDPEPQDDFQQDDYDQRRMGQPIASRLNGMSVQSAIRDSRDDTFSDRGDQESVQLVLRDTIHLDEEEAIRKGYRPAPPFSEPTIQEVESDHNPRSSWISSIEDDQEENDFTSLSNEVAVVSPEEHGFPNSPYDRFQSSTMDQSIRSTMASDAYTIVNIVLQQHSTSGIVDQQFVDDVYQRVLDDSPFGDESTMSPDRIEQICLQEIQDREEAWSPREANARSKRAAGREEDAETPTDPSSHKDGERKAQNNWLVSRSNSGGLAPPPMFKGHKYKSSLDSAEDWADTSPSVGDWMRFAVSGDTPTEASAPTNFVDAVSEAMNDTEKFAGHTSQDVTEDPDMYSAPLPRPPTHSPPPLPATQVSSIEEPSFGSAIVQRPQIPRRVTSVSQISRDSLHGRQSPSISAPVLGKVSMEEAITPEQRRLKQRKNVVKELVDTEFTYEKDLRVLCDIYKQTASVALGEDDIKVLFGNVEQIQVFSKDFLMLLKSLAKPTYAMERQERKKDKMVDKIDLEVRPKSSSSTLASNKASENEPSTAAKDRETRIGQAFEASLADMEKVYTEYIKNRHAANLRLEQIQKTHDARQWLKECKDNSSDITNAWNLDALLVKPVQRITKYPLLLKELVDATAEDHPDLTYLRRALHEITEVNVRINDVKKHAELVDQVLNRKRKDSDVRAGLSKAFGRRAEKLKQQVGMTELYEDSQYNEIKIHYDNNIVQLMVVGNDCSSYGRAITKWVNKMVEMAAAAEAWVDVGHSHDQVAESKLRQFAMVVRGISTIALPDHLEQLNAKVLVPMQNAVDNMTKFKTDPKGLLQKREKRMIDYAQLKSKKDRGEKLDKKTIERMEQSEALNVEAKERMKKLVAATAKLVQACQASLIQMQISWQGMVRQKLSAAMGISLEHLGPEDIVKEWQLDFDYQEASALALGICNGSLLADAVNMVSFGPSTTTLNGEDSPRQASFTSVSKKSMSITSEHSYPPIPDYDPRTSGLYGHQYHEHAIPYANPRGRAQSANSNMYARTPDLSQQGSAGEGFSNFARPDAAQAPPRLSVETPSPLFGMLQPDSTSRRPASSSTFFSASGTPPPPQNSGLGSSIFSSAMPMSDSPVVERHSEASLPADPDVLFTAASVYEFNIDRSRREAGFPYLTYVTGEIFDVIGERGELWLAKNQDDPTRQIGWIWNKHFAKLAV